MNQRAALATVLDIVNSGISTYSAICKRADGISESTVSMSLKSLRASSKIRYENGVYLPLHSIYYKSMNSQLWDSRLAL